MSSLIIRLIIETLLSSKVCFFFILSRLINKVGLYFRSSYSTVYSDFRLGFFGKRTRLATYKKTIKTISNHYSTLQNQTLTTLWKVIWICKKVWSSMQYTKGFLLRDFIWTCYVYILKTFYIKILPHM